MKDPLELYVELTEPRLNRIEQKLDEILAFKWKMTGIAVAFVFVFELGSKVLGHFIDG